MKTNTHKLLINLKNNPRKRYFQFPRLTHFLIRDGLISLKTSFNLLICLIAPLLLYGCLAPPIIPLDNEIQKISSLLIVPVESPPLEIIPDSLEDRVPIYRHMNNMSLFFPTLANATFINKDGIEIAGRVGADDVVQAINRENNADEQCLPIASIKPKWLPTAILASHLSKLLAQSPFKSAVSDHYCHLALGKSGSSSLTAWHSAIKDWYEAEISSVDYQSLTPGSVDAVVEIGIGNYRMLDTQGSLQVFMKLIKPDTGKVLARTRSRGYISANEVLNILHNHSSAFKQLITDLGIELMLENAKTIKLIKANS